MVHVDKVDPLLAQERAESPCDGRMLALLPVIEVKVAAQHADDLVAGAALEDLGVLALEAQLSLPTQRARHDEHLVARARESASERVHGELRPSHELGREAVHAERDPHARFSASTS